MLSKVQLPSTWATDYSDEKPYRCVEISSSSPVTQNEYKEIENLFAGYRVLKIQRVQNPFQYGRYEVYKLQNNSPIEGVIFMPIDASKIETALKSNCDYRLLGRYSEDDIFFDSVSSAVNSNNYETVIVLQVLRDYKTHNSGRYPKYIVNFEKIPDEQ